MKSTAPTSWKDDRATLWDFRGEVLVECPRCGGCAKSVARPRNLNSKFEPRRVTCGKCGFTQDWAGRQLAKRRLPCDDHFQLPVWLQTRCCGRTLWAYNAAHLAYLEELIGAKQRKRARDEEQGWRNKSIASRLPRWMSAAGNRDLVLRGLGRLRKRVFAT